MGKDKWAKVIEYLKSSNRDPEKVLKLLKGSDKGTESSYTIARSSYSMNVIATVILTFEKLRSNLKILYFCCFLLFAAIWIEKGFGLIGKIFRKISVYVLSLFFSYK